MTECEEIAENIFKDFTVEELDILKKSSLAEITEYIGRNYMNNNFGLITDLVVGFITIKIRALNLRDEGIKDME